MADASSVYTANDQTLLLSVLLLMLEAGAAKWAQYDAAASRALLRFPALPLTRIVRRTAGCRPATQERLRQLLLEDRAQLGAFVNETGANVLASARARPDAERNAALAEIEALLLNGDRQVRSEGEHMNDPFPFRPPLLCVAKLG